MSDTVEETASNDPNSPERERTRSPRDPPPPPPPPPQEAVDVAADQARRTCPVCLRLFDSAKAMWGHSWVHRERRDQIYAMNPPAPPPPPPPPENGGGVVAVGGGGGGGGSGWHPWKIDSREERDRTCPKCRKVFGSPKAMFGHLHIHYERPSTSRRAKGEAGPSAVAAAAPKEKEMTPARAAEEMKKEASGDGGIEADSPATSIDLNRPAREAEEEVDDGDSSLLFDLNMTPPSS